MVNSRFCGIDESRPHILSGYRRQLSHFQILVSVFYVHNETGNIWTHLIPGFLFSFLLVCHQTDGEPVAAKPVDTMWKQLYTASAAFSMISSAMFHAWSCHSKSCHDCLLRLDMNGIVAILFCSFLPGIYYGY
mmetsp:Transcript_9979/g.24565  ORF Transcript_9979/g.24565 Transcript_9979/m.24565 type:complete len:133 (-) Transcript_9979:300-698(-)